MMKDNESNILKRIDWLIILIYLLLTGFGLINIYSADYSPESGSFFDLSEYHGRQIIWMGISLVLGFAFLLADSRMISTFSYLFYALGILLLLLTLVIGKEIAGSQSWLVFGSLRMQPSEFAKFFTVLGLAKFLNHYNVRLSRLRDQAIAFGFILVPAILVALQNDYGSSMVFFSFVLVLFRFGLPSLFLFLPVGLGGLFLMVLLYDKFLVLSGIVLFTLFFIWFLKARKKIILLTLAAGVFVSTFVFGVDYAYHKFLQPHQQERIEVLLGQKVDITGAGYNIHQSLIAIGSGGIDGKGFLNGTQTRFNFVPEQTTDFIFCTVGEEYGFIGSTLLIFLFAALFVRLIIILEKHKSRFVKVFGYGVISVLFFHFFINIGMTLGMFPVVGIPLPFLSYGGSSLLAYTLMLFTCLKLCASQREYI